MAVNMATPARIKVERIIISVAALFLKKFFI